LQVAVGELLEQRETEEEITVSVRADGDTIRASVGPFDDSLAEELRREADGVGLRRVLETVVDSVSLEERDGQPWVELTKAVR
jgi:hypothetical protein